MKNIHSKIIILGSGPAGYTAAIYSARANLNPILITGIETGGQLINTNEIENWPGNYIKTHGRKLMLDMNKHALKFNTKIIQDHIKEVNFLEKPFLLFGEQNKYTADAVIIATGSSARSLGTNSEKKFQGKGISYCATCDGYFYLNQNVAVIGGGNSAVEESLYLSNIAKTVSLIHRRNIFKAEKILIDRLMQKVKKGSIKLFTNYVLKKIHGNDQSIEKIILMSTKDNKIKNINISGLFIAIGHNPNTKIFKNQVLLDNNYIKINNFGGKGYTTGTNIPGIFAAGDVVDQYYRQAITAASTGCMAALDAEHYLDNLS